MKFKPIMWIINKLKQKTWTFSVTAVSPKQNFEKAVNLFLKFMLNAHNFKNYKWDLINSFWDTI